MNPSIDRRALAPVCSSLILLLCTFNLSCSSNPCAPVLSAVKRLREVPNHYVASYWVADGREDNSEGMEIDGFSYIRDGGDWTIDESRTATRTQMQVFQFASKGSCHLERSELVDGEAAYYYVLEGKQNGLKVDIEVWLSKATGLMTRVNLRMQGGVYDGHGTFRYDYANISAPIVSK